MLKFSKIFLLSCLGVLVLSCIYFFSSPNLATIQLVKAKESIEYSNYSSFQKDCLFYSPDGNLLVSEDNYYLNDKNIYYTKQEIIVQVVMVNFSDKASFTENTYKNYYDIFDKVSNYFKKISRNYLTMKFNVNVSNFNEKCSVYKDESSDMKRQTEMFNEAFANSKQLVYNGDWEVACLMLSTDSLSQLFYGTDKAFWPHNYTSKEPKGDLMIIPSSFSDAYDLGVVMCHELLHTLGILDFYPYTNISNSGVWGEIVGDYFSPAGKTDMMATGYSYDTPTSAYNRYKLHWLTMSNYEDGLATDIETITQAGTYTISETSNSNGVISYRFGIKGEEFFMLEVRKVDGNNYLILQRINDEYVGNMRSKSQADCMLYTFNTSSGNYYAKGGQTIGTDNCKIFYSNEEIANYSIGNIVVNEDNTIQFDFFTSTQQTFDVTFTVYDESEPSQPLENATVVCGDITRMTNSQGQATLKVKENSDVVVKATDYASKTIKITPSIATISNNKLSVKMSKSSGLFQPTPIVLEKYIIKIYDITKNGVEMANSNYKIYVNNVCLTESATSLKNGDKIMITANGFETFNGSFANEKIYRIGETAPIISTDHIFDIPLVYSTKNYYVNVVDQDGKFLEISKLEIYDTDKSIWVNIEKSSIIYNGDSKYYMLTNVGNNYTQVRATYSAYGETITKSEYFLLGKNFYQIVFEKSVLQKVGDFFNNIKEGIFNIFK